DPHRKVGLVFDEWGTWWNVEPGTNPGFLYQQNTVRDALVASIHFDGFHRHADRLLMANIAQTVNVLQAMILTDPDSGALVLTPTYHVFAMNAGHQDARALDAHVLLPEEIAEVDGRALPMLSASASTTGETALVSLSNLDLDQERTLVLDLRGRGVTGHTATVLTGEGSAAHNTPEQPEAVAPRPLENVRELENRGGLEVTLPPHSFATVELQLGERASARGCARSLRGVRPGALPVVEQHAQRRAQARGVPDRDLLRAHPVPAQPQGEQRPGGGAQVPHPEQRGGAVRAQRQPVPGDRRRPPGPQVQAVLMAHLERGPSLLVPLLG